MIRKILSVLIIAAGLAAAKPVLQIDNTTYHAGNAAEGSKITARFKLTNTGTETLKLTSVRPGCGCTIVSYDSIIRPGRSITLEPVVDLKGMRAGHMSRGITVTSNASNTPSLQLTVSANIIAPITLSANYLAFDGPSRKSVYLSSAKRDLKVSGIVFKSQQIAPNTPGWTANAPISVNYSFAAEHTDEDGLTVYKLDIDPPPGGSVQNPVTGTFQITTNHPDKREITINGRAIQ